MVNILQLLHQLVEFQKRIDDLQSRLNDRTIEVTDLRTRIAKNGTMPSSLDRSGEYRHIMDILAGEWMDLESEILLISWFIVNMCGAMCHCAFAPLTEEYLETVEFYLTLSPPWVTIVDKFLRTCQHHRSL